MSYERANGPVYTAAFASTALTANPYDVFGIVPSSNSRVCVHEIVLGQPSSEAQNLAVRMLRGSTGVSTGAAITPQNVHGWTAAPDAISSVMGPSATLVSTTSATLLYADAFESNHFKYCPNPCDRPILEVSQPLHVRVSAPSSGLYGTIVFSEIGKSAAS